MKNSIPYFFDDYHLPPGEHLCTFNEIKDRFVYNEFRIAVWNAFKQLLHKLAELGIKPEELLIDGSFVTGREVPGDVDWGALIRPHQISSALSHLDDESDKKALIKLTDPKYQTYIHDVFGTHMLIVYNEQGLNLVSKIFRTGGPQFGRLRDPDPLRDPPWVKTPDEKGILKVKEL